MRVTVTEKVKRHIEQLIDRGDLIAGSLLPSEREVAENLGVARGTVRQAISQLVSTGRLVSAARQGTVVASGDVTTRRRTMSGNLWAVIVPSVDYFYPELVDAIEKEAAACGKRVLLACSRSDLENERQLIDEQIRQGASGIFLAPVTPPIDTPPPPVQRDYLAALPVPVVIIDHSGDLPDADVVLSDNFSGSYDATVHLLRNGRRKLALVRPGRNTRIAQERVEGYRAAMIDHQCAEPADVPPINAHDVIHARVDLIRSVVNAGVDAFVVLNDHTACALLRHLSRLSVCVPQQVAVVGYDDEPIASIADPPLTTVKVNKARMASLAVQTLNERLKNRTEGRYRHLRVRPTLIVRESCGGRPAVHPARRPELSGITNRMSNVS